MNLDDLPPLLFLPPNRVWRTYLGGRTLDRLEGRDAPADSHFPEDWIASTTRAVNPEREHLADEGLSRVAVGGESILLTDLYARFPEHLLGPDHVGRYGTAGGFLLKLLDSAIRLHLQCHPTREFARKHLNAEAGKTEAYVILSTRPEIHDPFIYLGFQHRPTPSELRRAVAAQDETALLSFFEPIPVHPGDVFLVPGGMPHAIGEGVFMIEIMEPTDLAVRLEFVRGGYELPEAARFMGRDLDFAVSMLQYEQLSVQAVRDRFFRQPRPLRKAAGGRELELIGPDATPCFRVKRLAVTSTLAHAEDSFCIAIVSRGSGQVACGDLERPVRFGDRFLIPFGTGEVHYRTDGDMDVVLALPPAA
ncbi:MAG: hypothetical protein ABIL09_20300 [Gemmatimonadota bacterium]